MQIPRHLCRFLLVNALVALVTAVAVPAFAEPASRLFLIARSKNSNVVHYDLKTDRRGEPEPSEPVQAYWVLHEDKRRREPLSFFERQMAYGFSVASPVRRDGFVLKLVAFDRRLIRVARMGERYRALVEIAGRIAFLDRIFVKSNEGGLMPTVSWIELCGVDAESGAALRERIRP